jgi:hypothetical protein
MRQSAHRPAAVFIMVATLGVGLPVEIYSSRETARRSSGGSMHLLGSGQ